MGWGNRSKIIRIVVQISQPSRVTVIMGVYSMELGSTDANDLQVARNLKLNYIFGLPSQFTTIITTFYIHFFMFVVCTQMNNLHQRGPSQAEFRLHYHKFISEKMTKTFWLTTCWRACGSGRTSCRRSPASAARTSSWERPCRRLSPLPPPAATGWRPRCLPLCRRRGGLRSDCREWSY